MVKKNRTFLLAVFFLSASAFAQQSTSLIQQATAQFREAEKEEAALNEKPVSDRTRAEYLKVVNAYKRVYLITPHTAWADNALTSMARMYEELKDKPNAIKTLQFLLHEYPQTPLRDVAERDISRLSGADEATTKEGNTVENLRFWEEDTSIRVVVDVAGDVKFKTGEAKSPDRYFIDISPARLNSMLIGKEWTPESNRFQKIRVAQYDGSTVRVVLDGMNLKGVTASTLKDPSRIILDVTKPGAEVTKPAPEVAKPAAEVTKPASTTVPRAISNATPTQPAPLAKPAATTNAPIAAPTTVAANVTVNAPSAGPVSSTPVAAPENSETGVTAAKPTNRGDRSLIRSLGLKLSRVVIDAGHGGHDTGSIGPSGFTEKELVLDIAKRLETLIESEMGAEVVMTRTDDVFVPLESRTQIANKEEADLFISIHVNSSQIKSVRGVETFFLNLNAQSREALETAGRENAASERTIHELQDVLKKIMLNDKVDESRELARHIQNSMSKRANSGNNRGVKQAPFVVLIGANMPSVLAEISFISNPDEERQLKTPAYRQQIAESLLQGIKSYAETLSSTKSAKAQEK